MKYSITIWLESTAHVFESRLSIVSEGSIITLSVANRYRHGSKSPYATSLNIAYIVSAFGSTLGTLRVLLQCP